MILVDTNVLTRLTNAGHTHGPESRRAVQVLRARHEQLVIVPQNLYEFWAVATRRPGPPPGGQNGLGMTCAQTSLWLNYFERRFTLLTDRDELPRFWHSLVKTFGITGLKSHDARLVAAMQTFGITRFLTFNSSDFRRFSISIIDPASV